jgi:hypothetical protein
MKKVSSSVSSLFIPFSILLTFNCATLTRRRTQRIPVTSSPAGATVSVNGVKQGVIPLTVTLEKKLKGQVIRIESPGYNPIEIRPERTPSGGVFLGNCLLGIVLGAVPAALYGVGHIFESSKQTDRTANLIWGFSAAAIGGVFTVIDTGSGKAYGLSPKDLTVTLTKADGTPRVCTLFVDSDDIKNIKWIRIYRD